MSPSVTGDYCPHPGTCSRNTWLPRYSRGRRVSPSPLTSLGPEQPIGSLTLPVEFMSSWSTDLELWLIMSPDNKLNLLRSPPQPQPAGGNGHFITQVSGLISGGCMNRLEFKIAIISGLVLPLVLDGYHSVEQMARRVLKECHSGNWWRGKNLVYVDSCQPGHWHPNWSRSHPLIFPAVTAASLTLTVILKSRLRRSETKAIVKCPDTERVWAENAVWRDRKC